jgi:hypothetical protein
VAAQSASLRVHVISPPARTIRNTVPAMLTCKLKRKLFAKEIYSMAIDVKANIKILAFSIVATMVLLFTGAAPVFGATPVVSNQASKKACFGQWRASAADGHVIAERQGDNADQNVRDKATCAQTPIPELVINGGYPAMWADAPMSSVIDYWGFYNRQSPSYVAFKIAQSGRYMPYGFGSARDWPARATVAGIPVSIIFGFAADVHTL